VKKEFWNFQQKFWQLKRPPAGRSAFNRRDHFYVSEKKLLFLFLFLLSTFIPIFYLYLLLLICDSFSKKKNHEPHH